MSSKITDLHKGNLTQVVTLLVLNIASDRKL